MMSPLRASFGSMNGVNPPPVPDHTLLRPIGRGAYGEVWLARNTMGTLRAVKIVWRNQFENDRPYEREFAGIRLYEPLSRSADGLVHVLHVGRNDADGYFYYVMELADNGSVNAQPGPPAAANDARIQPPDSIPQPEVFDAAAYSPRTLRSEVKRCGRLPLANCLRIALEASSGLAQLHRSGLIHRDVKPGNIIFVSERAKLADIGLVSADGQSQTFVGTEGYIPPEGPGSPGADLYALGVALYEASTGYPPDRFPEAPPEWFAEDASPAPLEFHQVILKTCEGQRERRYKNVEALQADLALLQSGQSVRRLRTMEKRLNRARRFGGISAVAIAITVTIAGLARYREHLMSQNLAQETRLRDQAQQARNRAEAAEAGTRQQLYTALLEEARATVHSGELGQRLRALATVQRAAQISNTTELRAVAASALLLPDFRYERELPTGRGITVAQLDPAFQRIALCSGTNFVAIRSVPDQRLIAQLPASTNLPSYAVWWSGDGRRLAVIRDDRNAGDRAEVEVWDVGQARLLLALHNVSWGAVSFHPKLPQMVSGNLDRTYSCWDLESGNELHRFGLSGVPIRLKFSPDGARLAVVCETPDSETLSVHDTTDGSRIATHKFLHHLGTLDWHPSGAYVSVPDAGGAVNLMDAHSGEVRLLGNHYAEAVMTAFSPDGNYLVSGGWDRELICWDLRTMSRAFVMGLKSFLVQFRADGHECAVITDAGVQLHTFEQPLCRELSEDLGSHIVHTAFSPDGRWFAASGDARMAVWNLAGDGNGTLDNHGAGANLVFGGNSELLARGDGGVFRWKVVGTTNAALPPGLQPIDFPSAEGLTSICASSNLVVFTSSNASALFDLNNAPGSGISWTPTAKGINGVSPDGRWLGVFSPFSPLLEIYSFPDLLHRVTLTNEANISSFTFAPGGELAIASHGQLDFYRTGTWERTAAATNFNGIIFCPDGVTCWLNEGFRSGGLYESRTLESLLPLPSHAWPLAVSPDGRWLAMNIDSRRVQLLDLVAMRARLKPLGLDWQSKPSGSQ